MNSPLFEPEEENSFELEEAPLPQLTIPVHVAPRAPSMLPAAPVSASPTKKRKLSSVDEDTVAYFAQVEKTYATLDPDATVSHNPAAEALPTLPAFNPVFAAAEKTATEIVCGLQQTILDSGDTGSEATYMKERLASLVTPTYPKPRMICFYGNCAAGKSSLMNACLGIEGLSLKSGDGSAGTLVPIEFWPALDIQKSPFMARVFWHDLPKCLRIVETAAADYWMARLADEGDLTKEYAKIDPGKPALRILISLFRDRAEFADEDTAVQFLSIMKSADDPKVLNKLLQWAREILGELAKLGSTCTLTAFTGDELKELLEPFTQESEYPEIDGTSLRCSVWPFVSSVKEYLSSSIGAKDIVLVDLPGVTDGNSLRVNCANRYLRQCDFVIVVANLDRGVDDGHLREYVLEVCRRKRYGKLALVLTKSDVIDEDECGRILDSNQQERLGSLAAFEDQVNENLRSSKRPRLPRDGTGSLEEPDIGLYEYYKRHITHRRTEILVPARNTNIRKNLKSWYRSRTQDPNELPVFCASSKLYMVHVKGYNCSEFPKMSLETTEIPALRKYIFILAGKSGKVAAFQRHCIGIRLLLSEMELSCMGSKPMMKRDHLLKILMKMKMATDGHFETLKDELMKNSVAPVLSKFDSAADGWFTTAEKLCQGYSSYPPRGFMAFLSHNGKWQTQKCPKADWDGELLAPLRREIQPSLDTFCGEGCLIFRGEAVRKVNEIIDILEEDMKNSLDVSQYGAFKSFFDTFRGRKQALNHIVDETVDWMQERLLALNNDSFNLGQSSPFTQRMAKIYTRTQKEKPKSKGGALHLALKACFSSLVCHRSQGPYPAVKKFLQDGLGKVADGVEKKLATQCGAVLDAIIRDFDKACPEKNDHSVLTLQRRETLGQKVQESKGKMDGELKSQLAKCGVYLD